MSLDSVIDDSDDGYCVVSKYKVLQYIETLPEPDKLRYLDNAEEFLSDYRKHMRLERAKKFLQAHASCVDSTRIAGLLSPEQFKKIKSRNNAALTAWLDYINGDGKKAGKDEQLKFILDYGLEY
jgi:hypothetical protein